MKKWILAGLVLTVSAFYFTGCEKQQKKQVQTGTGLKGPVLLSVDFEPNKPLVYNIVSERTMYVNLDPSGKYSKGKQDGKEQVQTEKLEMQISYKAISVDPLGISVIEATCNSAKVTRTGTGRAQDKADAVESLAGKTYTLKISPTGKIVDYSSLEKTSQEIAENAFGGGETKRGKVKNPDMVMDFLATQWNIWDSIATIKNPSKGIDKKSKWDSKLLAPMPYVSKIGRNVAYGFAGVEKSGNDNAAVITSTYSLSKTPSDVPLPYAGSFQMKGMFGFLQGYKPISLDGQGREVYDIDKGRIISDTQQYTVTVSASIFGLGADELTPNIKIEQKITMSLADNK
jgi:hypothetical protein